MTDGCPTIWEEEVFEFNIDGQGFSTTNTLTTVLTMEAEMTQFRIHSDVADGHTIEIKVTQVDGSYQQIDSSATLKIYLSDEEAESAKLF